MTRSRPYHKDDNAYVEQKNGHIVRRFLGYSRLDNKTVIPLMNDLYETLDVYLNHFVPSRKCLEKVRMAVSTKNTMTKRPLPTHEYWLVEALRKLSK